MKAPRFTLKNQDNKEISLPEKGIVVLYFYPEADTPGCTIEAQTFSEMYPEFINAGALVFGVSPDAVNKVKDFCNKYDLGFSLLADPEHKIADAYGAWGTKNMYGNEYEGILRKTFLIVDGEIEHEWKRHLPGKTEQNVLERIKKLSQ